MNFFFSFFSDHSLNYSTALYFYKLLFCRLSDTHSRLPKFNGNFGLIHQRVITGANLLSTCNYNGITDSLLLFTK